MKMDKIKKFSFKNDYSEGAHPNILNRLVETNLLQAEGYGEDYFSNKARKKIHEVLESSNPDIHFVTGGTQANLIIISSLLRPHESVISATTGHINVHEAGAIEATGHKVCVIDTDDGKLTTKHIQEVINVHEDEHMVKPKLVYISNSTELGTRYTKEELKDISDYCKMNNLYFFLDGARLGSAVASSNLELRDLIELVDVFYIGGTKNGALIGEAIVINNDKLKDDFRYLMKQRGALLAKGRIIGIQFLELFTDNLFIELAKKANSAATRLVDGIIKNNYDFLATPETNLIFPIFPNDVIEKLSAEFDFYVIEKINDSTSAVRLVTSWATKNEDIDRFINLLSVN
jgi:threonine aldolase